MELQQINNDFNPPHQTDSLVKQQYNLSSKQNTQFYGKKRLRQLHKHFYTNFGPYQQYFDSKDNHITLYKGKPQFYLHSELHDRQRLSIQRQSMYYRGAVDEYISDQFLLEFVEESNFQKGFVSIKRNKSFIVDNVLYYAHKQSIKAIQLPKLKQSEIQIYQQSINPLQLIKFDKGSAILQLQRLQNNIINSIYQGVIIIVRFTRKVVIFSVKERKIIQTFESQYQFTQINLSLYSKKSIQTIEYNGQFSILQNYEMQSNQKYENKNRQQLKIQKLVNSSFNLNRNQLILSKYQGIFSFDRRTGRQTNLYSVQNIRKQRIYSSIPLKGLYTYSPYIASCQSRYISIFDIRKPNQLVKKYYHQSEQSPPQVMNFYDGNSNNPLYQNILTCYSPYSLGSSLFLPLNSNTFQLNNSQYKFNSTNKNFNLLFDYGKSSKQAGLHHLYNQSVSVWNHSSNSFSVLKVDSSGTIDMQIFSYNNTKQKYQRISLDFQISNLNKPNSQYESQLYLQQKIKDKYLIHQIYYQPIQKQVQISNFNGKQRKKGTKGKKTKNQTKSDNKSQQMKQPATQVDLQDYLDGQYQNSQECQQSIVKRKLNFADLSQFTKKLKIKANKPNIPIQKKNNAIEYSLNSTQPNSQGNIFSQSISDDFGIKALSFHNKKLMNFSILENLKNEWDN